MKVTITTRDDRVFDLNAACDRATVLTEIRKVWGFWTADKKTFFPWHAIKSISFD
jgi:hypothetical protein